MSRLSAERCFHLTFRPHFLPTGSVPIVSGTALSANISCAAVFFQACFGASPLRYAVDFLPVSLTSVPFGFLAILSVGLLKKYRVLNWTSWAILVIGFGLFSTVREDASVGKWMGYQIICALGAGPLVCCSTLSVCKVRCDVDLRTSLELPCLRCSLSSPTLEPRVRLRSFRSPELLHR